MRWCCDWSIELRDEFDDLTSVARIGGTFRFFCEGNRPRIVVWNTDKNMVVPHDDAGDRFIFRIGNDSNNWKGEDSIFQDYKIRCQCGPAYSDYIHVPRPVLCGAGSQHDCGEMEICTVNVKTGEPGCQEAKKIHCIEQHQMKNSTFLCHEKHPYADTECKFIKNFGDWTDLEGWPQFEIPEKKKKMCEGMSCTSTFSS